MKLHQSFLGWLVSGFAGLTSLSAVAAPLHLDVYNPGEHSAFPVSSEIIWGDHEAVLIDAQFRRNDAEALVQKIRATGKPLTTIFISQGDPDFYFGLDVIHAAFPQARIVASVPTSKRIASTRQAKLAYWGPMLKDQAPQQLITPEPLAAEVFTVDGERIEVKGLDGANPERAYLWIPSLKTVLGGVTTVSGAHIWLADTPLTADRQNWLESLNEIAALHPQTVIPGHFLGEAPQGDAALAFTANYLRNFAQTESAAKDSKQLVSAMRALYPDLGREAALEFSAKVVKGEVSWVTH